MEDLVKDIGIQYAKTYPVAIASAVIPLLGLAVFLYKVRTNGYTSAENKNLATVAIAAAMIVVIAQVPAAIASARNTCRALASERSQQELGGYRYSTGGITSPQYKRSGCAKVWPNGP
jgi:hypothetical protein